MLAQCVDHGGQHNVFERAVGKRLRPGTAPTLQQRQFRTENNQLSRRNGRNIGEYIDATLLGAWNWRVARHSDHTGTKTGVEYDDEVHPWLDDQDGTVPAIGFQCDLHRVEFNALPKFMVSEAAA